MDGVNCLLPLAFFCQSLYYLSPFPDFCLPDSPTLSIPTPMTFHRISQFIIALCLVLLTVGEPPGLSLVYEVQRGDSLWSIARLFQMSVKEIKKLNRLRTDRVYPGQVLRLGPKIKEIPVENGPYYFSKPRVAAQQSRKYIEPARSRPIEDYRSGRTLLQAFDAEIRAKVAKNRGRQPLKGWKIVIDPGHGGIDPGAIVSNKDGMERSVYVVEDEYVYDIALRVYELLRLNGAEVGLTMISPNHLIRDNLRASVTFVHEQNEVYNDEKINQKHARSVRPGGRNLLQRVKIANRFFKGARKSKSLFISLHADNSPERPKGPLAIYLNRKGKIDKRSRTFAKVMQKALDHPDLPAQIAGRNLGVLRKNRAHAEVLVEIHNVHDKGEAYRLRFHKNRQEDAERILKGVLDYAAGR